MFENSLITLLTSCILILMSFLALFDVQEPIEKVTLKDAGVIRFASWVGATVHTPAHLFAIWSLALSNSGVAAFATGSIMFFIGAAGALTRASERSKDCNCFGGWSFDNSALTVLFSTLHIASSLLLACAIYFDDFRIADQNASIQQQFAIFAVILLIPSRAVIARHLKSRKDGNSSTQSGLPPSINPEVIVARKCDGKTITLEQLAEAMRFILIIGVSPDCIQCKRVVSDIGALKWHFKDKVQVQFVSEEKKCNWDTPEGVENVEIFVLHQDFLDVIKPIGYPFAVLIDPSSISMVAPTIYGERAIRNLFIAGLNMS